MALAEQYSWLKHCPNMSRLRVQLGYRQEATNEYINKWTNKWMFSLSLSLSLLPLPSLSQQEGKRERKEQELIGKYHGRILTPIR